MRQFANTLKSERGSRGSVVIIEDGQESALQGDERTALDGMLSLTDKNVTSHTQTEKDDQVVGVPE